MADEVRWESEPVEPFGKGSFPSVVIRQISGFNQVVLCVEDGKEEVVFSGVAIHGPQWDRSARMAAQCVVNTLRALDPDRAKKGDGGG